MTNDTKALIGIVGGFFFIAFLSHAAWYGATSMICEVTSVVPDTSARGFQCFIRSIIGMGLMVCAIPAGILYWLIKYLIGIDAYGGTMWFFGIGSIMCWVFIFKDRLFEGAITAASYTVHRAHDEPKETVSEVKRKTEHTRRETERKDAQTEMEDAIREMEEAKARLDELKK